MTLILICLLETTDSGDTRTFHDFEMYNRHFFNIAKS